MSLHQQDTNKRKLFKEIFSFLNTMLKRSLKFVLGSTILGASVGYGHYSYQNSLEKIEKAPEKPKQLIPEPKKIDQPKPIEQPKKIEVDTKPVKQEEKKIEVFVQEKAKVHYKDLADFVSQQAGVYSAEFDNFVNREFYPQETCPVPQAPPPAKESPEPLENKLKDLQVSLEQAKSEISAMQEAKESDMTEHFQEIYHKQLTELLPTVSEYFDKIRYAGMMDIRDEEWRKLLDEEIEKAEQFFEKKTQDDLRVVQAKVTAEMKRGHAEDLDKLTGLITAANRSRDDQIEVIGSQVRDIQELQKRLSGTIEHLQQANQLHDAINRLEQCLYEDNSNLPQALSDVLAHGANDTFIKANIDYYLEKIDPKMVPSLLQLRDDFEATKTKVRRAALAPSQTLWGHVVATGVDWIVPKNIRSVDDNETLLSLREAEKHLSAGNLNGVSSCLEAMVGYPREEISSFLTGLNSRLNLLKLLDLLMDYNNSRVKGLIN